MIGGEGVPGSSVVNGVIIVVVVIGIVIVVIAPKIILSKLPYTLHEF